MSALSVFLLFILFSYTALAGEFVSSVYNRPNPFCPDEETTEILYTLSEDADVEIDIYSLVGNPVRRYEFSAGSAGGMKGLNNGISWDGKNGTGRTVASGAYLAVITATSSSSKYVKIRKIAVMR